MGQSLGHLQVHVLKNHMAWPASFKPENMVGLRLVCDGLDSPAHLITLRTTNQTKQYLIIRCENADFAKFGSY